MRVLLADADERFLEVVQAFLWEAGHEAEIATDSRECFTSLREFAPDVLVLDHDLAHWSSDGEIADVLRDPELITLHIILVADEGQPVPFDVTVGSPVADVQRRPFLLPELLTRINSVGRRRKNFMVNSP